MNKVSLPLVFAFPAVVTLGLLLPNSVPAQHGAHVHSISNATLAIDRNQIEFNLQSPGANLVGFEHPPRDEDQTAALEQAKAMLQSGDWLRFASNADCAIVELELETPGFKQQDDHEHDHHDHEHHEHGDGHEHEHEHHEHADHHAHGDEHDAHQEDHHHADHDHHDHDHHEHATDHKHAEFHLRVRAECGNIEELDWIEFALFEGWTDHREMQLDVLTDRLQQRFELTAEQNRVELD